MPDSRPLTKLMLVLTVLGGSGCASLRPASRVRPYGAATLEKTDTAALSRSLEAEAGAAGLTHATLNLFPDQLAEGQHQGETNYVGDHYVVNGLLSGAAGLSYLTASVSTGSRVEVVPVVCRCGPVEDGEIAADFKQYRTLFALHEYFHLLAMAAGDNVPGHCARGANEMVPRPLGIGCNRNERIADTAMALYIRSNYKDTGDYPEKMENLRFSVMEPIHFTVSSIIAGMEAYRKHPRPGLTGEQIEHWAARIVRNQTGLNQEYDEAVQAFRDMNEAGRGTLPVDVRDTGTIATPSRDTLFGPRPTGKPRHEATISAGR